MKSIVRHLKSRRPAQSVNQLTCCLGKFPDELAAISAAKNSWMTAHKRTQKVGLLFWVMVRYSVGWFSGSQLLTVTFLFAEPFCTLPTKTQFPEWGYQSGNRKLHPPDALAFCLRYSA